jgi:hypothetical protein
VEAILTTFPKVARVFIINQFQKRLDKGKANRWPGKEEQEQVERQL